MTAREAVARALCAAEGDDWEREGPSGLLEAYGPHMGVQVKTLGE